MKASGKLHAPAALFPAKEFPVTIGFVGGGVPEPVWTR
jgi:hypothetical protein